MNSFRPETLWKFRMENQSFHGHSKSFKDSSLRFPNWKVRNVVLLVITFHFIFSAHFFEIMLPFTRGSKQDMQAAAATGGPQNAEYVGDEQAILESEQQYP